VLDDAARRQLRFSLFLQAFAFLMLAGALIVRVASFGWDLVDVLLVVGLLLVSAAAVYTIRRLRQE
jgi:hypothetical protein